VTQCGQRSRDQDYLQKWRTAEERRVVQGASLLRRQSPAAGPFPRPTLGHVTASCGTSGSPGRASGPEEGAMPLLGRLRPWPALDGRSGPLAAKPAAMGTA
jgi:hypothetical protein